jgi:hypothetical protein
MLSETNRLHGDRRVAVGIVGARVRPRASSTREIDRHARVPLRQSRSNGTNGRAGIAMSSVQILIEIAAHASAIQPTRPATR